MMFLSPRKYSQTALSESFNAACSIDLTQEKFAK